MNSAAFLEGNKNAQLDMSNINFGINPYREGTTNFLEWESGFIHAFTVKSL